MDDNILYIKYKCMGTPKLTIIKCKNTHLYSSFIRNNFITPHPGIVMNNKNLTYNGKRIATIDNMIKDNYGFYFKWKITHNPPPIITISTYSFLTQRRFVDISV
jgi:hypothetical protein